MMVRTAGAYAAVSGLCMLLHNGVLIGGDALGLAWTLATLLSFLLCVVVGYSLHARLTFAAPWSPAGLMRYALAMLLNLPLSLVAIGLAHAIVGLPMFVAAPLSTIALLAYNFVVARWAVRGPPSRKALP